jgi:hypothetical protein
VSVSTVLYPRWPPLLKIEISSLKSSSLCLYGSNLGTFWLKIEQFWPFEEISIFSNGGHLGCTWPISTKLCLNDPWVIPFQNCVRQRRPVSKMASITKNRNFFKWPKLLYFHPRIISAKFG